MFFKIIQQDSNSVKEVFVRLQYFKHKNNQKAFLVFQSTIYRFFFLLKLTC